MLWITSVNRDHPAASRGVDPRRPWRGHASPPRRCDRGCRPARPGMAWHVAWYGRRGATRRCAGCLYGAGCDRRDRPAHAAERHAAATEPGPLRVHHGGRRRSRRRPAVVTVAEEEGLTLVLPQQEADAAGLAYEYVAGWITLRVHSALEAVGLTAAVARELAAAGLSCNVVAGFHHDHLFVPYERVADAVALLEDLARRSA